MKFLCWCVFCLVGFFLQTVRSVHIEQKYNKGECGPFGFRCLNDKRFEICAEFQKSDDPSFEGDDRLYPPLGSQALCPEGRECDKDNPLYCTLDSEVRYRRFHGKTKKWEHHPKLDKEERYDNLHGRNTKKSAHRSLATERKENSKHKKFAQYHTKVTIHSSKSDVNNKDVFKVGIRGQTSEISDAQKEKENANEHETSQNKNEKRNESSDLKKEKENGTSDLKKEKEPDSGGDTKKEIGNATGDTEKEKATNDKVKEKGTEAEPDTKKEKGDEAGDTEHDKDKENAKEHENSDKDKEKETGNQSCDTEKEKEANDPEKPKGNEASDVKGEKDIAKGDTVIDKGTGKGNETSSTENDDDEDLGSDVETTGTGETTESVEAALKKGKSPPVVFDESKQHSSHTWKGKGRGGTYQIHSLGHSSTNEEPKSCGGNEESKPGKCDPSCEESTPNKPPFNNDSHKQSPPDGNFEPPDSSKECSSYPETASSELPKSPPEQASNDSNDSNLKPFIFEENSTEELETNDNNNYNSYQVEVPCMSSHHTSRAEHHSCSNKGGNCNSPSEGNFKRSDNDLVPAGIEDERSNEGILNKRETKSTNIVDTKKRSGCPSKCVVIMTPPCGDDSQPHAPAQVDCGMPVSTSSPCGSCGKSTTESCECEESTTESCGCDETTTESCGCDTTTESRGCGSCGHGGFKRSGSQHESAGLEKRAVLSSETIVNKRDTKSTNIRETKRCGAQTTPSCGSCGKSTTESCGCEEETTESCGCDEKTTESCGCEEETPSPCGCKNTSTESCGCDETTTESCGCDETTTESCGCDESTTESCGCDKTTESCGCDKTTESSGCGSCGHGGLKRSGSQHKSAGLEKRDVLSSERIVNKRDTKKRSGCPSKCVVLMPNQSTPEVSCGAQTTPPSESCGNDEPEELPPPCGSDEEEPPPMPCVASVKSKPSCHKPPLSSPPSDEDDYYDGDDQDNKCGGNKQEPPKSSCPLHQATHPENKHRFNCHGEGKFADPYNCTTFFVCHPKRAHGGFHELKMSCPVGEVFDQASQQCVPAVPLDEAYGDDLDDESEY